MPESRPQDLHDIAINLSIVRELGNPGQRLGVHSKARMCLVTCGGYQGTEDQDIRSQVSPIRLYNILKCNVNLDVSQLLDYTVTTSKELGRPRENGVSLPIEERFCYLILVIRYWDPNNH